MIAKKCNDFEFDEGVWWAACPNCSADVMFEGLEDGEIAVCPHCLRFSAVKKIWKELVYSNIIELIEEETEV